MEVVLHERSYPLSGCEKVAALLLTLDRDLAHRILKHFDQNELRRIAKCAANLGTVSAEFISPLIEEFSTQFSTEARDVEGSAGEAEELINGVVSPDQVADIMSHVLGSSNRFVWERLAKMDPVTVAEYLRSEDPQTISVAIQKLDPSYSAKVLGLLPSALRSESVKRTLRGRLPTDAALRIIELAVQYDLLGDAPRTSSPAANARVAGILNRMEREQINDLLKDIAQDEPTTAEELRARLFGFDDIPSLDSRALSVVFDQVSTDRLILALNGVEPYIKDAILPCLSSRTRRMVEAELIEGVPARKRDVLSARREIADLVLRLSEKGLIELQAVQNAPANL
jgi:flagellar motor switch protein FliG